MLARQIASAWQVIQRYHPAVSHPDRSARKTSCNPSAGPTLAASSRKHWTRTPGDRKATKRALEQMIAGRELHIVRTGRNRYERTLGKIYATAGTSPASSLQPGMPCRATIYEPPADCRR